MPARGSSSRTATWVRVARYLGPLVPKETLIWQDPIPAVARKKLINDKDIAASEAEDPRERSVGVATGLDRMGVGLDVPRLR